MKKNIIKGYFILIYALTLFFVLINNYKERNADHFRFFYNFTQQTNIIILVWLVLLSINLISNDSKLKFTKNRLLMVSLTVYISITYFIVALVLDPIYLGKFNPVSSGGELWLHHLTPIVMWVLLVLVKGEGELNVKKSLMSLIYPLVYVVLNLIVGATVIDSKNRPAYAYDFINPHWYDSLFLFIGAIFGLLVVFSLFTVGLTKFKNFIDQKEDLK